MSEGGGEAVSEIAGGVLGITAGTLAIGDRATLAAVCLALVRQCRRTLDIVSRHLDPAVYDTDEFVEAVKALAIGSRYARVRLLILDSRPLVTQSHRLIDLSVRLSSFIEIRSPAAQHKTFNEAILVADNLGYVHRPFSDRPEGDASFVDRRKSMNLTDRVEELWQRGLPDANFRRLHL